MTDRKLENWIESYIHYTRHHLGADQFHLWTALGVLSAAVNRNRWMDAGYYKTFPNLYILFIGPSGVGKSSSSGIGVEILREAKLPVSIFSDSMTAAGLIEFMSNSTVTWELEGKIRSKTPVMVYASEIGTLITKRNSIEELTLVLTELFNKNADYESRTKGGGKTLVRKPNLTFFACCFPEWIDEVLNSISLRSGFLGRILTVTAYKKRHKGGAKLEKSDTQLYTDLIEDLKIIGNQYGEMIWSKKAKQMWEDWTDSLPLDLTSDESIEVQGFISRKAQYVQRLAILHAISKKESQEHSLIHVDDLEFGWENLKICEVNARKLKQRPEHVQKTEKIRYTILRLQMKLNTKIIPIRDIMPYVFRQMSKEEVDRSIDMLCSIGFCELMGRKVKILDEKAGAC